MTHSTLPHTLFLAPPPSARFQREILPKGTGLGFGESLLGKGWESICPGQASFHPDPGGGGYTLTFDHLPMLYQDRVGSTRLRQQGSQLRG